MAKKNRKRGKQKVPDLRALERRVAKLERHLADEVPMPSGVGAAADKERWAVAELMRRAAPPGGVLLAGSIDLPDGTHVDGQWQAGTTTLLDQPWGSSTERLAALTHPARIELLRRVLLGARTTAALTDLEIIGTSGQLYHHLRPLLTAGWLRQAARGRYEVPADRVVPLLVVLAATGG
jgi:hypothetical protein